MGLPDGWVTAQLKYICDIIFTGDSINSAVKEKKYKGQLTGYPYIATKDIAFDSVVDYENGVTIPFNDASQFKIAPNNSTLICIEGGSSGRKIGFLKQEVCFGNKLCCIHTSLINSRFLYYYCQAPSFQMLFGDNQKAERKSVTIAQLRELSVIVPPLAEQHRIVAKIDALFSRLDKGVETLQAIRQQLQTYRQAVLKWAFEGKLTNTSFEKNYKLEELCFFITKGTTPTKAEMSEAKGKIPFIKVYNLTFDGTLDFSITPTFVTQETHNGFLARSKVIPNDVLMNIVGPPMGKVSIVSNEYPEWNINQAIARFRCNNELYNKYLAYYLLNSDTINKISKQTKATAGQFNLTLEICRNIEIPFCSISNQQAIVAAIESRLSVCDKLEQIVDENLAKATALRQSILKKAFEGRLVSQDPNDEPAEKLLERIKEKKRSTNDANNTNGRRKQR